MDPRSCSPGYSGNGSFCSNRISRSAWRNLAWPRGLKREERKSTEAVEFGLAFVGF